MAIDRSSFKYKVGDRVRALGRKTEWEIIKIQSARNNYMDANDHYRIKNLTNGCVDSPIWVSGRILYSKFEPCSNAVKILFDRGSPATKTSSSVSSAEPNRGGLDGDSD